MFSNVAGIEIENSFFADVHDNTSHDNTAGILVFDLPGLQQEGGHDVRVFNNTIQNNNTENFAQNSDIVSIVPAGTGFFVMANHDVEVFGNTIEGNKTAAAGIISYALAQQTHQRPELLRVAEERVAPRQHVLGQRDAARRRVAGRAAPRHGDGRRTRMARARRDVGRRRGSERCPPGPTRCTICVHEPSASAVCDMHFDEVDMNNPNMSAMVCGAAPFDCTLAPPCRR